jgi:uncharacterized protein (TIGR02996 family)
MTEDEAFIRTIVDRPGDDLPRLVYADWLDERDDPRGAYLRAEAEWAKAKQTAGFLVLRLNGLAEGLDPVWVARVSRPPVGVCCDHVRFRECGPTLDEAEMVVVERRLGLSLPCQLRAFLLNYNGGEPDPACHPYPASFGWGHMDMRIGDFYTASRHAWPTPSNASSTWEYEIEGELDFLNYLFEPDAGTSSNPLLLGLVPIAHTPADLGYLFVACGGELQDRVFHFRDYCHASDDPTHLAECAESLAHLLSVLRPDQSAS